MIRRAASDDLEVLYVNDLWTRRVGPDFFPDGPAFRYEYVDFGKWRGQTERYISEAKEYWLRHYQPERGDIVFDVGAGRGEDTVAFSRAVGKDGRVVAVEAHPLSFAILKSFCLLNGLTNVIPIHAALMDRPGSVRIADGIDSWMESAIEEGDGSNGVEVHAETLDKICYREGITEVAFLKMNIEGAERYALPGMASMMPRIRQICVACHDFRAALGHGERFRTREFVESFLTEHGFLVASREGDPRDYVRDHVFGLKKSFGVSV